jgi:hypothetical protein
MGRVMSGPTALESHDLGLSIVSGAWTLSSWSSSATVAHAGRPGSKRIGEPVGHLPSPSGEQARSHLLLGRHHQP